MADRFVQVYENVSAPGFRDASGGGSQTAAPPRKPEPPPVAIMPGPGTNWKDCTAGTGTVPEFVRLNMKAQGGLPASAQVLGPDSTALPVMPGYRECSDCGAIFQDVKLSGQDQTRLEAHIEVMHQPGATRNVARMNAASRTPQAKQAKGDGLRRYWAEVKAGKRTRRKGGPKA